MVRTKARHEAKLDIIRIIALVFVILIHCVESNWNIGLSGMTQLSAPIQLLVIVLYSFGRLSVPLFLFLTGYLMLSRNYKSSDVLPFYKNKVLRLLAATELWIAIYYIFYVVIGWSEFNILTLVKQMLFLNSGVLPPHMWYMPMIIGLYIFIPFVSKALQIMTGKVAVVILSISSFYLFLVPTINTLLAAGGFSVAPSQLDVSYVGGIYGVYMLVGYLCKKYWDVICNKLSKAKLLAIFLPSFILVVAMHYATVVVLRHNYSTWYDSFWILIASTALFALLLKMLANVKSNTVVEYISESVFGIYLVHYIFIYILRICSNKMSINSTIVGLVFLIIITIVLSVVVCLMSKKMSKSEKLSKVTKIFGFA